MKLLFFILVGIPVSVAVKHRSWDFSLSKQDCGFSPKDCRKCMLERLDLDHNGGVSKEEFKHAIKRSKSWTLKSLGYLGGVAMVFKNCDYDKNGQITARDLELSQKTCFARALVRCAMKRLC